MYRLARRHRSGCHALHALLAGCGYAPAGEAERHLALFRPTR